MSEIGRTRYVQRSLLDADERVIAHGCNLRGVMGAGVAKAIAQRWPLAQLALQHASASGALHLGSVSWAHVDTGQWVANVITQERTGRDPNVRYASYDGIDRGLREVARASLERALLGPSGRIAIPAIGSGLGNARWPIVEKIVSTIALELDVEFTVYFLSEKDLREGLTP